MLLAQVHSEGVDEALRGWDLFGLPPLVQVAGEDGVVVSRLDPAVLTNQEVYDGEDPLGRNGFSIYENRKAQILNRMLGRAQVDGLNVDAVYGSVA